MGRQIFRVAWEETSRENASDEDSPVTSSSSIISFLQRFHDWCDKWNSVIGLVVSVVSVIVAIVAILIPVYQWNQDVIVSNAKTQEEINQFKEETQRWNEEGAVYGIQRITSPDEEIDTVTNLSTGEQFTQMNSVLVISNTGRTQGTVIEMREVAPDDGDGLLMCVPEVNSDGGLELGRVLVELPSTNARTHTFILERQRTLDSDDNDDNRVLTVGASQITLQPGESRLVVLVGEPHEEGQDAPVPYDGEYDIHTADGRIHRLSPSIAGSIEYEHYMNLPGLSLIRSDCSRIAEDYFADE